MKRIFIKLFTFFVLFNLTAVMTWKASAEIIYGEDQRQEVEDSRYSHLSPYIVAMVDLNKNNPIQSYGKKKKLCSGARFFSQPSLSKCSGILIKGKYILTASHCVSYSSELERAQLDCRKKGWLLDYQTHNGASLNNSYSMIKCNKIIEFDKKNDYALIEIKKPQTERSYQPIISRSVDFGDKDYYALGFPSGLPMKTILGNFVEINKANDSDAFFNFDTSQGSSGSAVFNDSEELVGLVKSGKSDFTYNKARGCYEVNQCNDTGEECKSKYKDKELAEGVLVISKLSLHSKLRKILSTHY